MNKLKKRFWPEVPQNTVWGPTPARGVLATRLLPLITQYLNDATGQPVASTYLALICRQKDGVVWAPGGEDILAFESGYTGVQARNTWRKRMQALVDEGFVCVHKGSSGPMHFSLVLDPIPLIAKAIEDNDAPNEEDSSPAQQYLDELDLRFLELDIDPLVVEPVKPEPITIAQFNELAKKGDETVEELKASTGPSDAVLTSGEAS